MTLRRAVQAVVAVALVAGLLLSVFVSLYFVQLTLGAAVVLAGLLFEAGRYQSRHAERPGRQWQLTDEKFIDPASGHLMQVRFDPKTGERDYLDLGPAPSSP